jgi:GntR family transcriptional regulator/MocR family aminotransferase
MEVYHEIKNLIQQGTYQAHQRIPSKRKLAQTLNLSPLTIEAAYEQLIAEGYLYSIEKKGYFVSKQVEMIVGKGIKEYPTIHDLEHETSDDDHMSFLTNVVDTSLFPNATWAKLSREVISENHHEMYNHTPNQGLRELREEIAKYLSLYRGMNVHAERIIIGSGSTSLIGMIVELLGRKKHYAMESPGFKKIEQLFKANDVKLSYVNLDQEGLNIHELRNIKPDVIHLTPSHQFPTGIVMPISRRIEILNWATSQNAYIIEDDYDSEFRFSGKPIPALQGVDQNDRVIYMNTFTKSLAPSFRMSYMVLPKHLMISYRELSSYHSCTVPTFEQYVLHKFMKEGYFERHIHRMSQRYREKLEKIITIINTYPNLKIHGFETGLHFLLEIHTDEAEVRLIDRLKAHKINLSLLDTKSKNLYPYPTLVIGYSGIPLESIENHMKQLIDVIFKKK